MKLGWVKVWKRLGEGWVRPVAPRPVVEGRGDQEGLKRLPVVRLPLPARVDVAHGSF